MTNSENKMVMVWPVVLVSAAVLFSFALACAMPFAAIGALAALVLPWREALVTAILGWLVNQVIGFGVLGYPTDMATLAWGAVLGFSAVAAVMAALFSQRQFAGHLFVAVALIAFAAALLAQQAVVYAASWLLPSHPSAFSLPVIWQIGWTNALAFATFGALYGLGALAGIAPSKRQAAG
ncbi:hypothetical protein [Roseibium sp. MMSF_3544]|uniref:hypothetical protein n=1 Tax=unclassified Roseibium TaxID=2629323 RepID=UPI00273D2514|nr:hypothetical protein [Roseibium sp. MMSF_3544]